jgi:hypothetical protein
VREVVMSTTDRLWVNGFITASELLAGDRLALEEMRQAFEDEPGSDRSWDATWRSGLEAGLAASFGN